MGAMGNNKKSESENNPGQAGIRVLTVALFIILLAFFIVLNSIAVMDDRRQLEALGSLTGSFGILPGGLSAMKSEGQSITSPQAPMIERDTDPSELAGADVPGAGRVFSRSTPTGEVISIADRLLFDEGGYQVRPSSFGFLKSLCDIINQEDYPVEITGHTDSRPSDESFGLSNWALSSLRALEVLKFFVVLGEVSPARLTAYGRAEFSPIASNETRQTRSRNNRVEIVLSNNSLEKLGSVLKKEEKPSALVVFKRFVFQILD
jgi:chemotaxis protein MotB